MAEVEQGQLRGTELNGVSRFFGIPYAKPPVDALRWAPPQDPERWKGVRDASNFGSECAQIGNFYTSNNAATFDKPFGSEDCLYLNVWAPSAATTPETVGNKPVIVFIHGGSSVVGAGSLPLYHGQRLANELDAVFVNFNYRLGFFGIIRLAALRNGDPVSDSGSFALLDQIQALRWVQRNIHAFGGDANNITLMGHSAGCTSIWALMRSPMASGTFDKTVCLSGISASGGHKELEESSEQLLAKLLVADGHIVSADELPTYQKAHSAQEIKQYLQSKSSDEIVRAAQGIKIVREVADGTVVTTPDPGPLVNPVPSLLGRTRDEAPLLLLRQFSKLNYTGVWNKIHSEAVLTQRDVIGSRLSLAKFKVSSWATNAALHYLVKKSAKLLVASDVPVYFYEFSWDDTDAPWRELLGAYHGIDIPFVFGNFGDENEDFMDFSWDASSAVGREAIHQQLVRAMRGFIVSANPNACTDLGWKPWKKAGDEKIF